MCAQGSRWRYSFLESIWRSMWCSVWSYFLPQPACHHVLPLAFDFRRKGTIGQSAKLLACFSFVGMLDFQQNRNSPLISICKHLSDKRMSTLICWPFGWFQRSLPKKAISLKAALTKSWTSRFQDSPDNRMHWALTQCWIPQKLWNPCLLENLYLSFRRQWAYFPRKGVNISEKVDGFVFLTSCSDGEMGDNNNNNVLQRFRSWFKEKKIGK